MSSYRGTKLKRCPFCGKQLDSEYAELPEGFGWRIQCYFCHAQGGYRTTLLAARRAWNKRAGHE